jgi:hypothetical protein
MAAALRVNVRVGHFPKSESGITGNQLSRPDDAGGHGDPSQLNPTIGLFAFNEERVAIGRSRIFGSV